MNRNDQREPGQKSENFRYLDGILRIQLHGSLFLW